MSLRDAMRKAAGLLVELPPEEGSTQEAQDAAAEAELNSLYANLEKHDAPPGDVPAVPVNDTKTVEQIVRESEGPNLDEIKSTAATAPIDPDGAVDFAAIYQSANLPAAPFSAEQMLDMLASLPPELPLDTKRQTVKVTLGALGKTMGATPETIVADASRKLAALNAAVENLSQQSNEFVAGAEAEITALQAQIEEKRQAMQAAKHKLVKLTQGCDIESNRLDDVLEFFSLDVAPSKYATPEGGTKAASASGEN